MSVITTEKLGDSVGAQVHGVTREQLLHDDELPAWTLDALEQHGALVFRDLHLDDEAQDLLHLDLALRQLEALDVRLVHVVECRIFAGLSEDETAQALEVPLRTAQRLWLRARAHLRTLLLESA